MINEFNFLKDGERFDDLEIKGYKIIQNKDGFCFGIDAVLLSSFVVADKDDKVIDLGTGTGIIPILVEAKKEPLHLTGLEIQKEVYDMACRSVKYNNLEDKIDIVNGDIKEASKIFGKGKFDVVTTNPPYMVNSSGLKNPNMKKAISRHEILCNLEDVIREASYLLKQKGRIYMIHRPSRISSIICTLNTYKLMPKRIRFIHSYVDSEATMVMIEAVKGMGEFIKVMPPLVVYEKNGEYTEEVKRIYGK